jgi:endonuclease/exonuclease/phosphatase family metal-dependent hydrolase
MKNILLISVGMLILFAAQAQELKIMSYNIRLDVASDGVNRWDLRKQEVAALMNRYDAGFIGAQEVQHHQLQYLLAQMPRYASIGVGRDDGKTAGEYSCIFYQKEKYELLQQKTFWLSDTPDSVSRGWDAACNRVCTYGLFRSKQTRQLFWVFNTHFDHIGDTARFASARLVAYMVQKLNLGKNYPVILTGDFNARPGSEPVLQILSVLDNARSRSSTPPVGPADTWNAFRFDKQPDGCIDYIFVSRSKKLRVTRFQTITDSYEQKYPSDHFPVLTTVILKK